MTAVRRPAGRRSPRPDRPASGISRLGAVLAVVILAALTVIGSAGVAHAASDDDGVNRFGACLAAQKAGQVLLLIDESGSLQESDPQAARVTAAKYLARQLQTFAGDAGTKIDLAVSGFAEDYRKRLGWTPLTAETLPEINRTLDGLGTSNNGKDTDYWLALDGARTTLAEKKPQGGPTPGGPTQGCQMIAWFTDGALDFSARPDASKPYAPGRSLDTEADVEAMKRAAREGVCRTGGIADQLRSSGVVTIGIGLQPQRAAAADFDLMKSIVTGEPGPGGACGAIRSPAPGDFHLVSDIDDLLFAFDKISTPGQSPLTETAGVCVRTVCEEGKHRFVLDRSVGSVGILAAATSAGLVPYLVAPDGRQIRMAPGAPGTADAGGVAITYEFPSEKSVSVRMTGADAPRWRGVWALAFVAQSDDATGQTRSNIHITGDLFPQWPDAGKAALRSGAAGASLTFRVVNTAGTAVDTAGLPGQAALSAELVTAAKTIPIAKDLSKTALSRPQKVDLSGVPPGAATLRLTLRVTTASARDSDGVTVPGTALSPQTVEVPVMIDPPVGYPTIGSRIDFGTLEGGGSRTASLTVTGPGCAWLAPGSAKVLASPDGAGDVAVTAEATGQDGCITATDGQQADLPLTISVPNSVNGVVNGTVSIMVAPTDRSAAPLPVEVSYTLELQKPLNKTNFVIALIVALIAGPLIPLLLLYFVKWLTARIPAKALRSEQIRVRIASGTVTRDGAPFALRDTDLVSMVPGLGSPVRRIDLGGVVLRSRMGRSPFGAGFVVATAPGLVGAAGKSGTTYGSNPDARLPLAVHNSWFLLHDPSGPADAATVVVLAGGDATAAVVIRLSEEIATAAPAVLRDLRAKAAPRAGASGDAGDGVVDDPFAAQSPRRSPEDPFAAGGPPGGPRPGPPSGPPRGPWPGPGDGPWPGPAGGSRPGPSGPPPGPGFDPFRGGPPPGPGPGPATDPFRGDPFRGGPPPGGRPGGPPPGAPPSGPPPYGGSPGDPPNPFR